MDAVKFQEAARNLKMAYPGGDNPPIYFWNPTLDYDFVRDYTYNEIRARNFLKVPSIFGDTANEGWVFTPKSITSRQRAEQFLSDQFTSLNQEEKNRLRRIWNAHVDDGTRLNPQWKEIASDIYGHVRYTCGARNLSAAFAANASGPAWQYRWDVGTALHVAELSAIWNNQHNGSSAAAVFMQGYFASFIRAYDPNMFMPEFLLHKNVEQDSPNWEEVGAGEAIEKRMLFADDYVVGIGYIASEERIKCDALMSMGIQLEQ
jgi:carboxylesterase type B